MTGSAVPRAAAGSLASRLADLGMRILWFAVFLGGIVFPPTLGVLGAYIAMIGCLLLLPMLLAFDRTSLSAALRQPATILLALAFAALALAFALSARTPADVLMVANFLPLLLFAPAYAASHRYAHPAAARTIAAAGTGALLLSALIAWHAVHKTGLERAALPGDNPIHLAAMATVVAALSLMGAFERSRIWMLAAGVALGAALTVVLLSQSRGPFLAFPLFGLLALGHVLRRGGLAWPSVGLVLLLTGGVAAAAMLILDEEGRALGGLSTIVEFLRTGSVEEPSADIRLHMLRAGFLAFADSPIFGHGWAHFFEAARAYLPVGDGPGEYGFNYRHLHSDLADFGAAGGMLGLLAYGLILAAPIVGAIGSPRDGLRGTRIYAALALSLTYAVLGSFNLMFGWELQTATYVMASALVLGWLRAPATASA